MLLSPSSPSKRRREGMQPPSLAPATAAAVGKGGLSLSLLPDDVLARCLANLPSPLDLARAGAACRAWRAVARGCVKPPYQPKCVHHQQRGRLVYPMRPSSTYRRRDELWRPFLLRLWPALAPFLPPPPQTTAAAGTSR
jgi:hypothetical protein